MRETIQINYEKYADIDSLSEQDAALLHEARKTTASAYAPYSRFLVAAVARLKNGQIIKGTNQENASFPVGICAERVLLSAIAATADAAAIDTLAISYHNLLETALSNKPISPCGICRQSLVEYQERTNHPFRIILSGMEGEIIVLENANSLLPFSFGGDDMK